MLSAGPKRRHILTWFALLAVHATVIAALMLSTGTLTVPLSDDQPTIQVLLLPPREFPRIPSLALPPRALDVERLDPRRPPLLSNPAAAQSTAPGSSVIGFGEGVDWIAEARRAVRANDIRNQYSAYVSDKAAPRGWWPEGRRAGTQYKMANGDWIVWINSSCYFLAGAEPKSLGQLASTAKIACLDPQTARAD